MNYSALKHVFETTEQREAYFIDNYTEVLGEDVVKSMIDLGFLIAPASTKYHGNYEGGLFDHSANVASILVDLTRYNNLEWTDGSVYTSAAKIGILHDLCKVDQYKKITDDSEYPEGYFVHDDEPIIKGHGNKSIIYAQLLGVKLNAEELACISYHMGAFTDSKEWKDYDNAIRKYPNVLWTHTADMIASQIVEV